MHDPVGVRQALLAYASGWFPMDGDDEPELPWYSPDPRTVLELDEHARAALRRRVARSLRAGAGWELRCDGAFERVLAACARPRRSDDTTWITSRLAALYRAMHDAGAARSYEVWADGELAAGLLAVRIGAAAMLESMFHVVPHAGNVLVSRTVDRLVAEGVVLCDLQLPTEHTLRLGARMVPRAEYLARLAAAVRA